MAVFTRIEEEELRAHMSRFGIGALLSFAGMTAGVRHTNYRVDMEGGQYILTLYERGETPDDIDFVIRFMSHLGLAGIPVPVPLRTQDGDVLVTLKDRPALLTRFLDGVSPVCPNTAQCASMGTMLARMHLAAHSFKTPPRINPNLTPEKWRSKIDAVGRDINILENGLGDFLYAEIDDIVQSWPEGLDTGAIHVDLFPNNAFCRGNDISGVFDFEFACIAPYVFDTMMTLNAWCFENGVPDILKIKSFLRAYCAVRPLPMEEKNVLSLFGRASAMVFAVRRIYDYLRPVEGAETLRHDPLELIHVIRAHKEEHLVNMDFAI